MRLTRLRRMEGRRGRKRRRRLSWTSFTFAQCPLTMMLPTAPAAIAPAALLTVGVPIVCIVGALWQGVGARDPCQPSSKIIVWHIRGRQRAGRDANIVQRAFHSGRQPESSGAYPDPPPGDAVQSCVNLLILDRALAFRRASALWRSSSTAMSHVSQKASSQEVAAAVRGCGRPSRNFRTQAPTLSNSDVVGLSSMINNRPSPTTPTVSQHHEATTPPPPLTKS